MDSQIVRRAAPLTLAAALASAQLVGATLPTQASTLAASSRTFNGPTEETMHGPVQVSIVVKSRKIVTVKGHIFPNSDGRSPFLQGRAVPILKAETLKAQSANIALVSGATETSEAFVQSLESAIKKAEKARALK